MGKLIKPDKELLKSGESLAGELYSLLMISISSRNACGATHDIQGAYIRDHRNTNDTEQSDPVVATCECNKDKEETCSLCDESLKDICSVKDYNHDVSPFQGLGNLFATIKSYDYISLVEHAYAVIGNKPFSLKANKDIEITDEQIKKLSAMFDQNVEAFLKENNIRVDEIPQAFNFPTLLDMIDALEKSLVQESENNNTIALKRSEDVLERIFDRTNFMREYLEVIKDTADYPIGILWGTDNAVKRTRKIRKGKVVIENKIQSTVERVDPAEFWATPDHTLSRFGRAVFRLKRFSYGDLKRWVELDVTGSSKISKNVEEFLKEHEEGGSIPYTMLFRNLDPVLTIDYDVIVARGRFTKNRVAALGVEIPSSMQYDRHIPCEVYFSGSHVLRVKVMDTTDENMGVWTTLFRRNGRSIFGYSVYDFVKPFAKLYENLIDNLDRSVGKSVGMFIQVDTSVIENSEKYFKRDEDGNISLDVSEDNLIEFDSSESIYSSNFKGMPIHVTELPSNLNKLIPMLGVIVDEMERITKIPTLLTDGNNISSALRTTENMNLAFQASSKIIQALLRESETRILMPAIQFIFEVELLNSRLSDDLIDIEPTILLSDTLTREQNTKLEMLSNFGALGQFRDLIPPEKFGALLNTVGRQVFGYEEDLVPGVGILKIGSQTTQPQQQL